MGSIHPFDIFKVLLVCVIIKISFSNPDEVKPETLKRLKNLRENTVTAKKKYNCTKLMHEMRNFGFNITDCTMNQGNMWYRIDDLLIWEEAWQACLRIQGSDMASIHNIDDFNLLRHLFWVPEQDRTANWIGFNDIIKESNWTWTDGTTVDYYRWLAPMKEPNGGNEENCAMYQSQVAGGGCCYADGILDFRCNHELPVICKLTNPK